MDMQALRDRLFALRDAPYAEFQRKLLPTLPQDAVIGVRTPALRQLAKELCKSGEGEPFLRALPHAYFDENQLHAFLIGEEKYFDRCMGKIEAFLPYVDNWATCDQLSPKALKKHRAELGPFIRKWLRSSHTFTLRFAIGLLMQYELDAPFDPGVLETVAGVQSEEYYVNMMIAWFFATALAKQYDAALPYLTQKRLPPWVHLKTIQKAVESDRISPEQKSVLKQLRR